MYSISKETYEIMKEKCGDQVEHLTGQLVPSKLTNRLVWADETDVDPMRDFGNDAAMLLMCSPASNSTTDCSGHSSVASSGCLLSGQGSTSEPADSGSDQIQPDAEQLSNLWTLLRSIKDDCDFCRHMTARRLYPKHTLYDETTGEITCPIVLDRTCNRCGQKGHILEFCKTPLQFGGSRGPCKENLTHPTNKICYARRMIHKY